LVKSEGTTSFREREGFKIDVDVAVAVAVERFVKEDEREDKEGD